MKNLTLITTLGILALSVAATTLLNSIHIVGIFLVASLCALLIQKITMKFSLAPFVSVTILVAVAAILRLALSMFEPTIANHVVLFALGFQPLLIAMVLPTQIQAPMKKWFQAIIVSASAIIVIGLLAEVLGTGMIFGFELPFLVASSFFQTPAGIMLIAAAIMACTQIGKRGDLV